MKPTSRAAIPGYTAVRGLGVDRAGALVEAREDATERRVVLRVLSPALLADSHLMRRLRSGAQLRESLRHPNLVSVVAVADSGRALVYQWVDGVTLDRLLAAGPLSAAAALALFDDVLRGLEALHQRRVLHRDVRPESVVVDRGGRAMLRDADIPAPPLHAGWRSGTPQYMAPELWRGEQHSTVSDLYAATCVFVLAYTGAPPFAADDLAVLRRMHERGDVPGHSLPPPVKGVIAEGLAKDPAQRPADASRFRADLEVAAAACLGDGWRMQGREALSEAVRAALALPLAPPAEEESAEALALGSTAATPWWRRGGIIAAGILAGVAALVALIVVAATALTTPAQQNPSPPPVTLATPTGAAAVPAGGGPFTAPPSASLQLAGTPVPTAQSPVTPAGSATSSIAPVSSATPTPSSLPSPSPTPCPTVPTC